MTHKRIFSLRWLTFAVIITAMVSSVTLSRYISTVSGNSTATVAKFHVEMVAESKNLKFEGTTNRAAAETKEYTFIVKGNSDVTSEYTVAVMFSTALPSDIVPTLDGVEAARVDTSESGEQTYHFNTEYYLDMGKEDECEHTLTLTRTYIENDTKTATGNNNFNITISVTAQQTTNSK